ncbi:MAG: ABC transporter permease, partial [Terriglobales bacterium]
MLHRRRKERELQEELDFHLARAEAKYGSRQKAAALLGGEEATKEACRDERRGVWLASIGRDLRLGARILRKSPGFTAAAVITLALCIGVVTAVFSLLDVSLFTRVPFPHPDRIVSVVSVLGGSPAPGNPLWAGDFEDFRHGASTFAELAGYDFASFNLAARGRAAHVSAAAVTPEFFRVMGAAPARGRSFVAGERHAAVLSDRLWQKQFGGTAVLGKTVQLDGKPYTIVGIMPKGFAQANYGAFGMFASQIWVPLTIPADGFQHSRKTAFTLYAIGRLRPGATVPEAKAQVEAIAQREAQQHPDERGMGETAMTLRESLVRRSGNATALAMFMVLAVFVLLIGCANVAGLGLGRAAARADEMAIRRALGAGRARLVRQVLTESLLLAAIAGALGLLIGWLGIVALDAAFGQAFMHVDGRVLLVTIAAAMVTALAAGLAPALRSSARPQPRGVITGRGRLRGTLVAVEIGLTAASLIVIGVGVVSIWQEAHQSMGFDAAHVLAAKISLKGANYGTAAQQEGFARRLRVAAAALPGVASAALISPPPLAWNEEAVAVRGRVPLDWTKLPEPKVFYASRRYLRTLKIPLVDGRAFGASDTSSTAPVAIISRDVARRLFAGGSDPIGKFIRTDGKGEPWRKIIGEVGDVATFPGDTSTNGEIYEPLAQARPTGMALGVVLRTPAAPDAVIAPLREALAHIDATLALYDAGALQAALGAQGPDSDSILGHLLELMAGLALLLTAIGLYSVVAYT